MLDNLYENIGGKIKNWAKWLFIVEAISAIITGIVLIVNDDDYITHGILTLICGPIVAWVGSWLMYAFGQLVEDVHAMRDKEGTTKEVHAKHEAEAKMKREAELKAQQEAVARAKCEAEKIGKWQEENQLSDEDFIDCACPKCGVILSFLKNETKGVCPNCDTKFEIK